MTNEQAFEAFATEINADVRRDVQGWYISDTTNRLWLAWQAAIKQEREQSYKLADALQELLSDAQQAKHESCTDGGYCPVRDAREALEGFRARSEAKE